MANKNAVIEAIPTEYAGVEFRSRLEANTAQFFDACGMRWEYEPKSFLLPNGVHYRPDFYLPIYPCWVECRGYSNLKADSQIEEFPRFLEAASPRCGFVVVPWHNHWYGYLPAKDDCQECTGRHHEDGSRACPVGLSLLSGQMWHLTLWPMSKNSKFISPTLPQHIHIPYSHQIPRPVNIKVTNTKGIPHLILGGVEVPAIDFIKMGWIFEERVYKP